MALTRVEEERITDMRLKLQSAANSLKHIEAKKVPGHKKLRSVSKTPTRASAARCGHRSPAEPETAVLCGSGKAGTTLRC